MASLLRLPAEQGTLLAYREIDPFTGELTHGIVISAQGYEEREVARAIASELHQSVSNTAAWISGPGSMLRQAMAKVEPITIQGGLALSCAVCIRKGQMVQAAFTGDMEVRLARRNRPEWLAGSEVEKDGVVERTFGLTADDVLVVTTRGIVDEVSREDLTRSVLKAEPGDVIAALKKRLETVSFRAPQSILIAPFRKNLPAMGSIKPPRQLPEILGLPTRRIFSPRLVIPIGAMALIAALILIFGRGLFEGDGEEEPAVTAAASPTSSQKIPRKSPVITPVAVESDSSVTDATPPSRAQTAPEEKLGEAGTLLWKVRIGGSNFSSSPRVEGRKAYVGSKDNHIYCLSVTSGEVIWKYETEGGIGASPEISGERLFFGSYDSTFYCINRHSGKLLWKKRVGNRIVSSPAVHGTLVYCGSDDHSIYAWRVQNGSLEWSYETGDVVWARPLIVGNRLYTGSLDAFIYCLDAKSGALIWKTPAGGKVYASVASAGSDDIIFATAGNRIARLANEDGEVIWEGGFGDVYSTPLIHEGLIYFGSKDGVFHCLAADKGNRVWSMATTNAIRSSPVVHGKTVYIGGYDGKLYALNRDTGKKRWEYDTDSRIYSTPAVSGGRIFFGDLTGWFHAVVGSP